MIESFKIKLQAWDEKLTSAPSQVLSCEFLKTFQKFEELDSRISRTSRLAELFHTKYRSKQTPDVAKFKGKHLCRSLSFYKVAGLRPEIYQKRLWYGCFPACCEIFKNIIFTEYLWATASENNKMLIINKQFQT